MLRNAQVSGRSHRRTRGHCRSRGRARDEPQRGLHMEGARSNPARQLQDNFRGALQATLAREPGCFWFSRGAMLVNPHNELIARHGRNGRNSHGTSPPLQRHAREVHCVFVRPRHACVAGPTQCQRNSASIWRLLTPSFEGVTNRRGGKRWTCPRLLPVPPSRPTSRPVGYFGRRKSVSRFSSSQPPRQRPHHQGQPSEGPDRQYDRAVRQAFHAGDGAA